MYSISNFYVIIHYAIFTQKQEVLHTTGTEDNEL